ncbi:MAG: tautomerase family protein [Salaquimonas sp.]|jgi:4-oxalocrotonate tautomerase|nr:tautomerase family protein [Salaquimonas sp.]
MPFVSVRIVKQAIAADPDGKKSRMANGIAKSIAQETGLPPGEVWVVFEEVEARDWFLGTENVKSLRFHDA